MDCGRGTSTLLLSFEDAAFTTERMAFAIRPCFPMTLPISDAELQVGVITQTHGIRGEVKVFPMTDDVKRFKNLNEVILETEKERLTLEIEGVKFFRQKTSDTIAKTAS